MPIRLWCHGIRDYCLGAEEEDWEAGEATEEFFGLTEAEVTLLFFNPETPKAGKLPVVAVALRRLETQIALAGSSRSHNRQTG
jgi:hypothetical protein